MSGTPEMTKEEFNSDKYENTEKLKVFVYSTTKHMGRSYKGGELMYPLEKNLRNKPKRDVDYIHLMEMFPGNFDEKSKDVHFKCNMDKKESLLDDLENQLKEDEEKEKKKVCRYGAYLFVFLTFLDQTTGSGERIMLNADVREAVTLNEIWDKIKTHPVLTGKPKIFLVQADDPRLLDAPSQAKGPTPVYTAKIPQEADRITVMSTIPQPGNYIRIKDGKIWDQNMVKKGQWSDYDYDNASPSFLIKAFVEVLLENDLEKFDFLSLTVSINNKITQMINKFTEDGQTPSQGSGDGAQSDDSQKSSNSRKSKMKIEPVCSTLRKLLFFKMKKNKN